MSTPKEIIYNTIRSVIENNVGNEDYREMLLGYLRELGCAIDHHDDAISILGERLVSGLNWMLPNYADQLEDKVKELIK